VEKGECDEEEVVEAGLVGSVAFDIIIGEDGSS
jgi:hypothetical protein